MPSDDKLTLEYYAEQAKLCGDHWSSTMQDEIVRTKEIGFIESHLCSCVEQRSRLSPNNAINVLDLGCGNGYTTELMAQKFQRAKFWGGDFCDNLLVIAKQRGIPNCQFCKCDARKLQFEDGFFDFVYTERCLINIRDWEEQKVALSEVARVLKPGGVYAMIECFMDGHQNYNKARAELGLSEIPLPSVNLFFDKDATMAELGKHFDQGYSESNFLSSHYFAARVLHAAAEANVQGQVSDKLVRNSEFVKFFSAALPPVGNYSPIQGFVWKRKS